MPVDYLQHAANNGLSLVLYRGEDMVLLAFDIDQRWRRPDFLGFGIQYRIGDKPDLHDVFNFLTFKALREETEAALKRAKTKEQKEALKRKAIDTMKTTRSPIQLFRWAHVPSRPIDGKVTYRVSAMFADGDRPPVAKATVEATIDISSATRGKFLNVGFTRGFASSQAYIRRFQNDPDILPKRGKHEIDFDPTPFEGEDRPYPWLGFEARRIMLGFLDECIADKTVSVDVFAYDLSNPEVVRRLEALGKRLRIIIDTSGTHGKTTSEETRAEKRLVKTAGRANVKRHKFSGLQHNKVFVAKRAGKAFAVLTGSTNFALRGLYIQNNNVLLFRDEDIAKFYANAFQAAFPKPDKFKKNAVATQWFGKKIADAGSFRFCFSPHSTAELSMKPLADAVEAAKNSVMYAIAFYGAQTGLAAAAIRAIDGDKIHVLGVRRQAGIGQEIQGQSRRQDPPQDVRTDHRAIAGSWTRPAQSGGPEEGTSAAVQRRMARRIRRAHAPQVRDLRLQRRDARGVHRVIQPGDRRRAGKRRQPDRDPRSQGGGRLRRPGREHLRPLRLPCAHEGGQEETQGDGPRAGAARG